MLPEREKVVLTLMLNLTSPTWQTVCKFSLSALYILSESSESCPCFYSLTELPFSTDIQKWEAPSAAICTFQSHSPLTEKSLTDSHSQPSPFLSSLHLFGNVFLLWPIFSSSHWITCLVQLIYRFISHPLSHFFSKTTLAGGVISETMSIKAKLTTEI